MMTHTKLDYKPPLSLRFNGKVLEILEWGEVKEHYRIYSKDYDSIDTKDIPKLLSSYSLTFDIIDTEKYYKSHHLKEQDILDSMKQDTSLPEGSYCVYTKDIEPSLQTQIDYLYTRARGYKALHIYALDTHTQYKLSYYNNPLDNIKGNKREVVEGNKQEHIEGNIDITSQSQGNIYTQKGLYIQSQTLSFQAKDVANMESDSMGIDVQSDCAIQAGNQINFVVGDTSITTKGDCIIIKAGGVEVVIDSNGLIVKGGEIKVE